jgi:HNH/ENDO VII superfamily nuclease
VAEPTLIDRADEAAARRSPTMERLVEVTPEEGLGAALLPEQPARDMPPAPEAARAGRAAAARATTAMQARFGNARAARLMTEPTAPEPTAPTTEPATTPAPTAPAPPAALAASAPTAAAPPAAAATVAAAPPAAAVGPAAVSAAAAPATSAAPAGAAPEPPAPEPPSFAAPEQAAPGAPAAPAGAAAGAPPPPPAAPAAPAAGAAPPTAAASAGAPAEAATPAPPPALDTVSTEGMVASLAAFPPSALGAAVAQASNELPALQTKEKAELTQSLPVIDRPTGLPPRAQPPNPPPTQLGIPAPETPPAPEGGEAALPAAAAEVATGPVPGANVSTAVDEPALQEEDSDSWWSSIWGRIRSFVQSLATTDPNLSTSAGPRPKVDLPRDTDPAANQRSKGVADTQVQDARAKANAARGADFGENDIAPVIPERERLRPGYKPGAPPGAPAAGRQAPAVDPEVQAAFDKQAAPTMAETVAKQREQEATDREEYRQRSVEVRAEGERRIEEETDKSRKEQKQLRDAARSDVAAERERWREQDEAAGKDYSEKAETERRKTDKQVEEKTKSTEEEADRKLTTAEREAEEKKREAEAKAAAKKREAESRPRSWWDRVKGAVSSAFAALKSFVTDVFNKLRSAVRGLINLAKAAVHGLIELARSAIVGFIRLYGLALKGLVSIALFAFPETAAKARAFIDDRVNETVDAVNSAADALKRAADQVLDWVAEGLDFALSLIQKAVLFYIEIYETLVNLLMDVLERIWNLVQSARGMPDHFLGQMSEEVLGMDLTQPLAMERKSRPKPGEAIQAGVEAGTMDTTEARVLTKNEITPEQIEVQETAHGEPLDPELIEEVAPEDGKEVEFGERKDPELGLKGAQQAAMPAPQQAAQGPDASAGPKKSDEELAEDELQALMAQPSPSTCSPEKKEEPAGSSQVPEHMKIGPLTVGQRGRYMLDQMLKGIKQWFACNWGKLLAGAVGVLLGAILLNVLTGGAIMAALPLIMQIVSAVMLVSAVGRVLSYIGDYLGKGWEGEIATAAKALARGLAIAAIELVFALLFNLGAVIKALKGGVKGAVIALAKTAKATIVSGIKAVKGLASVAVQGFKAAVKNGKLLVKGIASGFARGAKSLKGLATRLWQKLPFKRFKISFERGWFKLYGWLNPWVLLSSGRIENVPLEGRHELGDMVKLAGKRRVGVVVGIVGDLRAEASTTVKAMKDMTVADRKVLFREMRRETTKDGVRKLVMQGAATGANAKALRKAMTAIPGKVLKAGEEAHHIVPSTHRFAEEARKVLEKFRIGVNEAHNGAALSEAMHAGMHSADYMTKVTTLLKQARSRRGAIAALNKIEAAAKSGGLQAVLKL